MRIVKLLVEAWAPRLRLRRLCLHKMLALRMKAQASAGGGSNRRDAETKAMLDALKQPKRLKWQHDRIHLAPAPEPQDQDDEDDVEQGCDEPPMPMTTRNLSPNASNCYCFSPYLTCIVSLMMTYPPFLSDLTGFFCSSTSIFLVTCGRS